jgi:hypothetical protein
MDVGNRRIRRFAFAGVLLLLASGAVVGTRMTDDRQPPTTRTFTQESTSEALTADAGASGASVVDGGAAMTAAGAGGNVAAPVPAPTPQAAPTPAVPTGQPRIVKNASITVQLKDGEFDKAFNEASSVASAHGGFVVSSDSNTGGKVASGVLTLRVPADAFDVVRTKLSALGTVKQQNLSGQDVSGTIVDLDARLRSLQAQEDALRQLMTKARTIGETIEVQNQLTGVRQQIEQLSGERARLADAASFATIRFFLAEPGAAATPQPKPEPEPGTLRHAVSAAIEGTEQVLSGTIIVIGWTLPIVLLAIIAWALWRTLGRRTRRALPTEAIT